MHHPSQKQAILDLLSAGHYRQALQQSSLWLATTNNSVDALYVSGLSYLFLEDYTNSIHYFKQSIEQKPDNAIAIANLGIAYLRSGETETALTILKQAIEIQPDYELAQYNLGSAYIQNQQADLAIDCYLNLQQQNPDNAEYHCALADAQRETGQWLQAIKHYKKTLKLDNNHCRAHTNLGPIMAHLGKTDEAITHCLEAIKIEPEQTLARKNLGDCYLQLEQIDVAMDVYADAYDIDENDANLCVAIANVWLETAEFAEASSWYLKAGHLDEDNILAQCGIAQIEREIGNLENALEILQPLQTEHPDNIDVLIHLSDTLWDDGDAENALHHLQTVQQLQPQRTVIYAKIGTILSSAGDVNNAMQEYLTALEQNPHCLPALNGLATSQRGKLAESNIATLKKLLKQEEAKVKGSRSGALASLHSSLACYLDGSKQYEKAAQHFDKANHNQWQYKHLRGWHYDITEHEEYVTQLMDVFNADYFQQLKISDNYGENNKTPVFVVAMPRSGTTLTEQILARHKKILGIGERNFATQSFNQLTLRQGETKLQNVNTVEQATLKGLRKNYLNKLNELAIKAEKTDASHVVDKMPDNYLLIGWILTLFPQAKIIHVKRQPADVALSCWMTQFGSIPWACNKNHLSHRIQQYQRIMQHWRETIPDRFIEISYEKLVENQLKESQRLIQYLNLDWDENCLKFYESDRLIRTASITQVRQPIYKKSVCRWKAYQPYISDLFNI